MLATKFTTTKDAKTSTGKKVDLLAKDILYTLTTERSEYPYKSVETYRSGEDEEGVSCKNVESC